MAKRTKTKLPDEVKEFFQRSGRKGGKNSRKNLTAEEKRELGQRAARARWAKKGLKAVALALLLFLPARAAAQTTDLKTVHQSPKGKV